MLKPEDIMVDTYRPSKRSGLRVGVDYGVKVTHKPTGIFVVEYSERSQHRNREFALQKLDKLVAETQTTGAAELPEALRLADELRKMDEAKKYHPSGPGGQMLGCEQYRLVASGFTFEHLQSAAAELRRLHAYCQELESQVILDCMTHVQNPAEIKHVAGDVSKNGAESDMAQQPAPSVASKAVLTAIRAANMQLVRTGDDEFMLVTYKNARAQCDGGKCGIGGYCDDCSAPQADSVLEKQRETVQAGAVPLTNARLQDISLNYSDSEDECTGFRDGWRAAEKHHGIKGGQHGADT